MATLRKRGKSGRWQAIVRRSGVSDTQSFATKAEAERWARQRETAIDQGIDDKPDSALTFQDLLKVYEVKTKLDPKSSKAMSLSLSARTLPTKPVFNLTVGDFLEFGEFRRKTVSPAGLRNDLGYIKTVLTYGSVLAGIDSGMEPVLAALATARETFRHTKDIGQSKQRETRYTDDELNRVLQYLEAQGDRQTADIARVAVSTALRQGEVLQIRWEDFDADKRELVVRERKHPDKEKKKENTQTIPLPAGPVSIQGEVIDPVDVLNRQPKGKPSDPIFAVNRETMWGRWRDAIKICGMSDHRFHDLRHEAISRFFEHGLQIHEVAVISGHRTWDQLKRYTNIKADHVLKRADELSRKPD